MLLMLVWEQSLIFQPTRKPKNQGKERKQKKSCSKFSQRGNLIIILLLSNITAHMVKKCPLKHQIVKCASCLNPNTLALSVKNQSSKLKFSENVGKAHSTQADQYQACR